MLAALRQANPAVLEPFRLDEPRQVTGALEGFIDCCAELSLIKQNLAEGVTDTHTAALRALVSLLSVDVQQETGGGADQVARLSKAIVALRDWERTCP